ncbi:class I SAM-dependent methyltransferase [Candidatus Parcubacteria bacterium]|nr:class I SAM-dependent methyltransferase [Candidatus Parcubacteria bacterium]
MSKENTKEGWGGHWGSKDVIKRLKEANTAYPEVVKLLLNLSDENSNCIELGCGSGTYAIELLANNRKCIASDFSEDALKLTKKRGLKLHNIDVPTQLINIYNIPYPDNSFDLIFSDGVIEHLDIPKALKEMKRVLKPNGWMIAKVPSGSLLYRIIFHLLSPIENRPYEAWFCKKDWQKLVVNENYQNVDISKCGSVLTGFAMRIHKMKNLLNRLPAIGRIYFLIKAQK